MTGLQLVGFALRGRLREQIEQFVEEFVGSADFGDRYLWEEVLERQPDDVRSFLLRTSILDRFTADLCDAVTETRQRRRADPALRTGQPVHHPAGWARPLVPLPPPLRRRAARTPEPDRDRRRARRPPPASFGAWLEENGYLEDAIRHAIAGHVWDRAVGCSRAVCAELFEHDHVATLRTWLEGLPPHVLGRLPATGVLVGLGAGTNRSMVRREPVASHRRRGLDRERRSTGRRLGPALACRPLGCSAQRQPSGDRVRAASARLLAGGSTHRTNHRPADTQGVAHLHHGEPARPKRRLPTRASRSTPPVAPGSNRSRWRTPRPSWPSKGSCWKSTVLCRQVIKAAGDQPTEIWVQAALYQLGQVYLEWGLLDDARRCFLRADDLAEMTQALHWRDPDPDRAGARGMGAGSDRGRIRSRSSRPSASRTNSARCRM